MSIIRGRRRGLTACQTTPSAFFVGSRRWVFLRLATNPSVLGKHALTLPDAWQKHDLLMSDPRVAFAVEPADLENHWRTFAQHQSFSPQVWNDAYLAAFAVAGNLEVITFDKAFTQYPGLRCAIL
jgi:predicted nucleic acid-binding protein